MKGAAHRETRSRFATFLRGSPSSSASTSWSVAGASARQEMPRMPGVVASRALGRFSRRGASLISFTSLPARSHTSVRRGNRDIGTWYENGRCKVSTSRYWPSGDGAAPWWSPGAPSRVTLPAGVDQRDLVGVVVLEQRLVVGRLAEVLERATRGGAAEGLLDDRPGRDLAGHRGRAAAIHHRPDHQRRKPAGPGEAAVDVVDLDPLHRAAGGAAGVDDPQGDAVAERGAEREVLPVAREGQPADLSFEARRRDRADRPRWWRRRAARSSPPCARRYRRARRPWLNHAPPATPKCCRQPAAAGSARSRRRGCAG